MSIIPEGFFEFCS